MSARPHAVLLLIMGLASAGFAFGDDYALLMNPTFRWITIAGAFLVAALGLGLLVHGGRASRGALVVFAAFFGLVAWAQPQRGGLAPLLAPPDGGIAVQREGYVATRVESLFESLDTEATNVPDGTIRLRGFVKRTPALDARGEFILLEPMMACCLADAIALGIRVRPPDGVLPEDEAWIYAFGRLTPIEPPKALPPFRVGAILFTSVSRTHRLMADEVVGYTALLPDVLAKIPAERCSFFLRLLQVSGVEATLRENGPFTVLAPLDRAFEAWPAEQRAEVLADPEHAREIVSACILPGRHTERALHEREEVLIAPLDDSVHAHLTVISVNGRLEIGNARVLFGDILARNGIVHVVHPVPYGDP